MLPWQPDPTDELAAARRARGQYAAQVHSHTPPPRTLPDAFRLTRAFLHSAFLRGGGAQPQHEDDAARLSFAAMGSILASVRRVGVRAGATFRAVGVLLQTSEAAREARVAVVVKAAVTLTAAVLNLLMKRVRLAAALTPLSARALSEVVSAATGWCREALGLLLAIEPLALGPFAVSLGQDVVACSHIAGLRAGMNAELQASGARAHFPRPTSPCPNAQRHSRGPPLSRHGSRTIAAAIYAKIIRYIRRVPDRVFGASHGAGKGQQVRQRRRHDANGWSRQPASEPDHAASRAQCLALGERLPGNHRPQPRESEKQARW